MPSSTTMPPTNTRGCADGWPVTRAGPSTSPRPRRPGLTPLKASSPSSHASVSSAASSNPSSTCNSPSTASWPRPTPIPNPSSGPPTPNASSPPSSVGSKCWSQSTSAFVMTFLGGTVLGANLAVAQQPAPLAEPQQHQQQEKALQTPSGKMGKEEPSSHAPSEKPGENAVLAN